jgi:hypothetical protein
MNGWSVLDYGLNTHGSFSLPYSLSKRSISFLYRHVVCLVEFTSESIHSHF